MFNKNKEDKSIDNTYGGIRYRFSYDDSRRAAAVRLIRRTKRGSRSFWLTAGVVSVFCLTIAGLTLVYRGISEEEAASIAKEEAADDEVISVNAFVETDQNKSYPGRFSVSAMTERAREVYHMPHGVMVSEVLGQSYEENASAIICGDIITAVDGTATPDVNTFDVQFIGTDKRVIRLSIFREGKHISLDYVIDNEE